MAFVTAYNEFTTDEDTAAAPVLLGNLLANDAGAAGTPRIASVTVEGITYSITVGSNVTVTTTLGTLHVGSDGSVSFLANNNTDPNGAQALQEPNAGLIQFTYIAQDVSETGNVLTTSQPTDVDIYVSGINDAPAAAPISVTINEDAAVSGTLPVASDAEGDSITYSLASVASHGTAVVNADGSYSYTPTANYNGADSFSYTVSDGNGGSNTYTVSVSIAPVNDAPTASAASISTNEDTAITGNLPTATEVDGEAVTYSLASVASHGTAVVNADGSYSYTPSANYYGPDSFSYTVSDGNGGSNTYTVSVTVAVVNDAPTASAASISTNEDTAVTGTLPVASDVEGDSLTYALGTGASHGTAVVNADGSYSYTPTANYNGADSFSYTVSDGNGGSNTYTVSVSIAPVNDAPTAPDQSLIGGENTGASANLLTGLLSSGTSAGSLGFDAVNSAVVDPDIGTSSDSLTVVGLRTGSDTSGNPGNFSAIAPGGSQSVSNSFGTLTVSSNGSVNFVSNGSSAAVMFFSYLVKDQAGSLSSNVLRITLSNQNDPPALVLGSSSTVVYPEQASATAIAPAVTLTDVDSGSMAGASVLISSGLQSGDALSYSIPAGSGITAAYSVADGIGTLMFSGASSKADYQTLLRSLAFAAPADEIASVARTIEVKVFDGVDLSNTLSLIINVTPVNDAPVITGDLAAALLEGSTYIISGSDLGYTDPDDGPFDLTFTVSNVEHGLLQVNGAAQGYFSGADLAAGLVTFVHDGSNALTAGFSVVVEDGDGDDSVPVAETFSISATPINDAPTLTGLGAELNFIEGDPAVRLFSNVVVSADELSDSIESLTVTVSGLVDGSAETIVVEGTTIALVDGMNGSIPSAGHIYSVTKNLGTATVVFAFASGSTPAEIAALIGGIAYSNSSETPTSGRRIIALTEIKDTGGTVGGGVDVTRMNLASTVVVIAVNGPGTSGDDIIFGTAGSDSIDGQAGDDLIEGRGGADSLDGGTETDLLSYEHSDSAVAVALSSIAGGVATASGGDATGDLARNFENLLGSAHADTLKGNGGANVIEGGAGGDTLTGGSGLDTISYQRSAGGVAVTLRGSTLAAIVSGGDAEGDVAIGFEHLTGSDLADVLTGDSRVNVLDGRGGADVLTGGAGNDVYYVDDLGDVVIEVGGQGTDVVRSTISYVLGTALEQLTLLGTNNIDATGNAAANTIIGNAGANRIDGSGGADRMQGLGGDDIYIVDHTSDVTTEVAGGGIDTVLSSVTYTLRAEVENLQLTGSGKINGTGNALANVIAGNGESNSLSGSGGNDTLVGGGGVDKLTGGAGADAFVLLLAGDGPDTIVDYAFLSGDRIHISGSGFGGLAAGQLDSALISFGSLANYSTPFFYDKATDQLYYDADVAGTNAAVLLVTFATRTTEISGADIVVV